MLIVRPTSLAGTIDSTAEAFFYHQPITDSLRGEIAALITSRQTHTGKNAGLFIPFTAEMDAQGRLFTGEMLHTAFARTHHQMIEAARILKLLAVENFGADQSIQVAAGRMLSECYSQSCTRGECKPLIVAYLRYLAQDETPAASERVASHLVLLSSHRDGKGRWNGFPFYYTLLMLTEVSHPQALQELLYAQQVCQKLHDGKWDTDQVSKRRQATVARALTSLREER